MNFTTENNESIPAAAVKALEVDISSTKVQLTRSGTEFAFRYYESEIYTYEIGLKEGTLVFREHRNGWQQFLRMFSGFKRSRRTTELVIPETFEGRLAVRCVNGDLTLESGAFSSLSFHTTNGAVTVTNVSCTGELGLRSTNGMLNLDGVTAQSLSAETTNGRAQLVNVIADTLTVKSTNGGLGMNSVTVRSAELHTTNGDVSVLGSQIEVLSAHTTNGDVQIALRGVLADYRIDAESSRHSFSGNQSGNGSGKSVYARTTNGSISVSVSET